MWKEEYSRFEGLTKETYDKYRYGLTHSGYFIYRDEDEYGIETLEILVFEAWYGGVLMSQQDQIRYQTHLFIEIIHTNEMTQHIHCSKQLKEQTDILIYFYPNIVRWTTV